MPEYVIYRKASGRLDCIPKESRLFASVMDIVETVQGTCITAWSRLEKLEREENNAKNH